MLGHKDFSVIVQRRAPSPKPWRWEIYRLGRKSPIEFSKVFFETITEASRAGERALALLLSECSDREGGVRPGRKLCVLIRDGTRSPLDACF